MLVCNSQTDHALMPTPTVPARRRRSPSLDVPTDPLDAVDPASELTHRQIVHVPIEHPELPPEARIGRDRGAVVLMETVGHLALRFGFGQSSVFVHETMLSVDSEKNRRPARGRPWARVSETRARHSRSLDSMASQPL